MRQTQTFKHKQSCFTTRRITTHADKIHDKNLISLCEKIDAFFFSRKAEMLKNDHSSTVIKVVLNESVFVIKRDNPVNFFKYIKRLFKKSRSFKVWHKERLFASHALDTLTPLALVEDYIGFIRRESFVVSEYIAGPTLESFLKDHRVSVEEKKNMAFRALRTLRKWHERGVCHRDPKAKNIIIQNSTLFFIDTEDVSVPRLAFLKRKDFSRDIAIMLFNFREYKEIKDQLLKDICETQKFGLNFLAGKIIRKFWKTEMSAFTQRVNENRGKPAACNSILNGRVSDHWKKKELGTFHQTFVSADSATECITMRRSFYMKRRQPHYRAGRCSSLRGIVSVTICLGICGFVLPNIVQGGVENKREYLVFRKQPGQLTFKDLLLDKTDGGGSVKAILITVGKELGRFHAMGFIHNHLSLDTIYMTETDNGYQPRFDITGHIRWCFRKSSRHFNHQAVQLGKEIAAVSSQPNAALFIQAHTSMIRKK